MSVQGLKKKQANLARRQKAFSKEKEGKHKHHKPGSMSGRKS